MLGWIMRIYSALEPENEVGNLKLKELFEGYSFVHLCNVTRVLELRNISRPLFPMTWRFLPLLDPMVDRLLCRDLDSLLTAREVAATNQWLDSKSTFHWMHDHPNHCGLAFLGGDYNYLYSSTPVYIGTKSYFEFVVDLVKGMWGVKTHQNREAISQAAEIIFYETQHEIAHGFDQTMLNTHLISLANNDVVIVLNFLFKKRAFMNFILIAQFS